MAPGRVTALDVTGQPLAPGHHYEWVAEEGEPASVLTDANGRFAFDDLPAATRNVRNGNEEGNDDVLVTDDWGDWYLLGYTLEVEGNSSSEGVLGLPVTRLLDDADDDPVSRASSKVHRSIDSGALNDRLATSAQYRDDRYVITLAAVNEQGDDKSVLDGRLVLADHATTAEDEVGATEDVYYVNANGMEFDLSTIRDADCMNGGFGPFGRGTIAGVVWDDANYDGIRNYKSSFNSRSTCPRRSRAREMSPTRAPRRPPRPAMSPVPTIPPATIPRAMAPPRWWIWRIRSWARPSM